MPKKVPDKNKDKRTYKWEIILKWPKDHSIQKQRLIIITYSNLITEAAKEAEQVAGLLARAAGRKEKEAIIMGFFRTGAIEEEYQYTLEDHKKITKNTHKTIKAKPKPLPQKRKK